VAESQRHIIVLANSVMSADATGKHVCDVARALVSCGYRVTVAYDGTWTRNDDFVRSMSKAWRPGESLPECDILLVEYSGWYALS